MTFSQNTTFLIYQQILQFCIANYSKIFEYLALFEYYSNIFHGTNNIHYSIWSTLLRQIIFDIWFGQKKIFIWTLLHSSSCLWNKSFSLFTLFCLSIPKHILQFKISIFYPIRFTIKDMMQKVSCSMSFTTNLHF